MAIPITYANYHVGHPTLLPGQGKTLGKNVRDHYGLCSNLTGLENRKILPRPPPSPPLHLPRLRIYIPEEKTRDRFPMELIVLADRERESELLSYKQMPERIEAEIFSCNTW